MAEFCAESGFGLIQCLAFKRVKGMIDTSLYARDGVHLSFKGVEALLNSVIKHLTYEHKYD